MSRFLKYLIILVYTGILFSCNKDKAKLVITDFSEPQEITLEPYDLYPYTMMNVWITGHVNDTIILKMHSDDNKPILKLSGNIKERWYTDYYGEGSRTLIFDPYKATKGELKIEFQL